LAVIVFGQLHRNPGNEMLCSNVCIYAVCSLRECKKEERDQTTIAETLPQDTVCGRN
jgi:hypothetical protein